jgi:DNA-binding transcriptional regulator YhcF (GntR family)
VIVDDPLVQRVAALHPIDPATAAKGLNQLVADGVLYKRRRVGMFVATGAREQLLQRRRSEFADQCLTTLPAEADKAGITVAEITGMLQDRGERSGPRQPASRTSPGASPAHRPAVRG